MSDVFESLWSRAVRDRHPLASDRHRDLFVRVHAQNPSLAAMMLDAERLAAHASSDRVVTLSSGSGSGLPEPPAAPAASWLDPAPLAVPPRPWSDEDWERDRRRAEAADLDITREEWEVYAGMGRDIVSELFEEGRERERLVEDAWQRRVEVVAAEKEAAAAVAAVEREAAEAEAEAARRDEAAARGGDLSRAARLTRGGLVVRPR